MKGETMILKPDGKIRFNRLVPAYTTLTSPRGFKMIQGLFKNVGVISKNQEVVLRDEKGIIYYVSYKTVDSYGKVIK